MTRGGGSHRSRVLSSMASAGDTVDDTVRDETDATGEESRTVNSRVDAHLETVGKERILMPSNNISRSISAIFKRYLHPTGFAWKKVSLNMRMFYWTEFKKEYKWACSDDEVLPVFWKKCADRYGDLVYHMKKDYLAGTKPEYVKDEDWPGWIAYWQAEPTQEMGNMTPIVRSTSGAGGSSSSSLGGLVYTQGELDKRLAEMQAQMDEKLTAMQAQMQAQIQAQIQDQIQAQLHAHLQAQMESQSRMESLLERLLSQRSGSTGEGSRGPDGGSS